MFSLNPAAPLGDLAASAFRVGLAAFGPLPYDPNLGWDKICFSIAGDGDTFGPYEPQPTCENAACVLPFLPPGTGFRHLRLQVPDAAMPLTGFQVSDVGAEKALREEREVFPSLWARVDSEAPFEDLESYNQLARFGLLQMPAVPAEIALDIVVLVTPQAQPCQLPALQRRS